MALLQTSLEGLSREDLVKIIREAEKAIAVSAQEVEGLEGMWLREGDPWELKRRAEVAGRVGPWCWSKASLIPIFLLQNASKTSETNYGNPLSFSPSQEAAEP